jgi:nitrogen regulatory protein P-II 2
MIYLSLRRSGKITKGAAMKMIIAIIQPSKFDDVRDELYKADINLMTISEVLGHGRQKGVTEFYRGAKEMGNFLRKIRLEIAVNDSFVQPAVNAILKGARADNTGETGDGKIFILPLEEVIRIRTGEHGSSAIG